MSWNSSSAQGRHAQPGGKNPLTVPAKGSGTAELSRVGRCSMTFDKTNPGDREKTKKDCVRQFLLLSGRKFPKHCKNPTNSRNGPPKTRIFVFFSRLLPVPVSYPSRTLTLLVPFWAPTRLREGYEKGTGRLREGHEKGTGRGREWYRKGAGNKREKNTKMERHSWKLRFVPVLGFFVRPETGQKLPQIVVFSLRESVLSNNVGLLNPAVPIPFEAPFVGKKRMRPKYHRSPSDSTVNVAPSHAELEPHTPTPVF